MFRIAAYTDIGPRKSSNQDSVFATSASTPFGDTVLLGVCDGVGGLSSGELASATVARWFASWFEADYPVALYALHHDGGALLDQVQRAWEQGLYSLNNALQIYGRRSGEPLGTTCTVILLVGGQYLIAHIGDTRAYRFSAGRMDILTVDQTWVMREVARGNIPPEKARFHPKRNVILQSVGTQPDLQPVFSRGAYGPTDTFMVCCDGFRNELFDDEIRDAFNSMQASTEDQMEAGCKALAQLALERGERDNISVVVASGQGGHMEAAFAQSESDQLGFTARLNDPVNPKTTILAQEGSGA